MPAGRIDILRDFASPQEGVRRTIRLYLPAPVRSARGAQRFPCLIMQDGQNLFDHPDSAVPVTWGVNRTLDRMIRDAVIEPCIVIGVDHRGVERISDYSPFAHPSWPAEARGERYVDFLVETLLPWAADHLPISTDRQSTAIAGSSMGGLIALYAGWRHPQVFGRIAALSPTVMAADRALFHAWSERLPLEQRIYLDAGKRERFDAHDRIFDYGRDTLAFHRHLLSIGYRDEEEVRLVLEPRGRHDEASWRRRFPEAIRWLAAA